MALLGSRNRDRLDAPNVSGVIIHAAVRTKLAHAGSTHDCLLCPGGLVLVCITTSLVGVEVRVKVGIHQVKVAVGFNRV